MKSAASNRATESRTDTRVRVRTPIELRRFGHSHWEYKGTATDRSQGGLGADVEAIFAVGEVVEIRFPDADPATHHRVRVVYRNNRHHYGLQFLDAAKRC